MYDKNLYDQMRVFVHRMFFNDHFGFPKSLNFQHALIAIIKQNEAPLLYDVGVSGVIPTDL